MKQYKDMTKKELIAVIAQKDEEIITLSEQIDKRGKLIDELRNAKHVTLSPDEAVNKSLELLCIYEPEDQNIIVSKILTQLSANRYKSVRVSNEHLNRAKEHLTRSEESLSQFLLVANGSKYAEVKA